MKKKLLISLSFLLFFTLSSWAQITVKGKVVDKALGEGVPQAKVYVKGNQSIAAVTDVDGKFTLSNVPEDAIIVVSASSFLQQEFPANAFPAVVQMSNEAVDGDVVVTGYTTTTKVKTTIAEETISDKNIKNNPNPSIAAILGGKVSGLLITTASGQPGANSEINLRGVSSINGDTEPMFIIDGIPVDQDNFRGLNPNEIASVTVLKDAAATAIYGNRGANGVIIVKTKGGAYDSPLQVTYTFQRTSSHMQKSKFDFLSAKEQLELERLYGKGRGSRLTQEEIDAATETDWIDYFFSEGLGTSHNLQLQGGSKNLTSYVSLGYFNQEGMLQKSSLKRYNLRTNINGKSDNGKFTYGVRFSANYSESQEPTGFGTSGINSNFMIGALQGASYVSPDEYISGADLLSNLDFVKTPLFLLDKLRNYDNERNELKMISTLSAGYEFMTGLTASIRSSIDFTGTESGYIEGPFGFNGIYRSPGRLDNPTPGTQEQAYSNRFTYNQVFSVNYEKTFAEKHNVSVGLFTEYYKAHRRSIGYSAKGLDPKNYHLGTSDAFISDNSNDDWYTDNGFASLAESGLFSYFTQVNYDYAGKYGAALTIRRDASSRFPKANRWGTFYAISGRWNIDQESFMESLSFVDILKLRVSYGTNGNQYIAGNPNGRGDFIALDLYKELYNTGTGYKGDNSLVFSQIPNETLKWETVKQFNIGIDAEFIRGRLRSTVDYYIKNTVDLFQSKPISSINGVSSIRANIGSLQNTGIDFKIAYDVLSSEERDGLKLTLNLLGNYNKQKLLDLPSENGEIIGIGREGGKIGEYYDYRYVGVNPGNGNLLFLTKDGEITENPNVTTDRVWLDKNIYPDVNGSFGITVSYKGFRLSTQFNYSIGGDRYDFNYSSIMDPTNIGQFRHDRDILDAWTPENRYTTVPALKATNVDLDGDRFLSSVDYLRLRIITLSYNIPQAWLEKAKLRTGSVFINAENLFTKTPFRSFDPEALTNTPRIYPTPYIWSVGFEIGI